VRLFVAVNLPADLRDAVWAAAEGARRGTTPVRWVGSDGIHVTLKFLGEVADERLDEMRAALGRAAAGLRPFTLTLSGGGVFPNPSRPRVFWVGIDAEPQLELLQHAVEREIAPLGFPTEARAFRPHATLGRAERDAGAAELRRAAERLADAPFAGSALIETVDLMRSSLSPRGARYEAVHRERLG
jgi:2'-5' RNA ligase